MKRLITIIMILAMIMPTISLADFDAKCMTDQQLKEIISICSNELQSRVTTADGWVLLFEYEGASIYQIGKAELSSNKSLSFPVAVINNRDEKVNFEPRTVTCNGWEIDAHGCGASANTKKKGEIYFFAEDADIESLDDITSLKFSWTVCDWNYNVVFKTDVEEYRFW